MDRKTLLAILQTDSMALTRREIQGLLNEELAKEPEQADTAITELCKAALEKGRREEAVQQGKKAKRIKFRKAVLLAAVFLIFSGIVLPVSAQYSYANISSKIVKFYATYFDVDLRQGETNALAYSNPDSALVQELQKQGFPNIILPADLLDYSYSEDINVQHSEYLTIASIEIEDSDSGINGTIHILDYMEPIEDIAGKGNISSIIYNRLELLTVNGLDVLVFESDLNMYIKYLDQNIEYRIELTGCDFEKAVEIANSIE